MHPLVDTEWLAREIGPDLRVVDVPCPDPARKACEAWRAGPIPGAAFVDGVPVILAPSVLRRDSDLALPFATGDAPG